jgi:SAM-dependent methyltransferase
MRRKFPEFDLSLEILDPEFIHPPRETQKSWILQRFLDEVTDDLKHLDRLTRRFVSGSHRERIKHEWDKSHAHYADTQLIIENQQVMQDWERPLMQAMADMVTESHGDILEVGFGMGISATKIQEAGVRSHTIIEINEEVTESFDRWRANYPQRNIRLVRGKWQDVVDELGPFDGVFFDAYPLDEAEFLEYIIESVTFAEKFFPAAAKCLRPGGCFTYYTNEIDTFSRRHQRLIFEYFRSLTLSVVRPLHPPQSCNYWWADSMVVAKATK